ncbi:MAG: RNA-binding protein [Candidatus Aenigmarchaeota archaeon]|nr:RNA-binding protein [Candidatus Aenigmarchaeota archaeon]
MEENIQQEEKVQRKLVIPGDLLGEGRSGHGTYFENGKVFSRSVGLAEDRGGLHIVIPLGGVYSPKKGDGVIGRIEEIIFSKWIVGINSPYQGAMTLSDAVEEFVDLTKTDLTKYFEPGDLIFAEISAVSKSKQINLSMKSRKCRKLRGGRLIKVVPSKVPRIIGRSGSMVELIKNTTGTQIVVGQNGLVWVKGENEDLATEAILLIDEKSHIKGLTEFMKDFLEKSPKRTPLKQPIVEEHESEEFDSEESDEFN